MCNGKSVSSSPGAYTGARKNLDAFGRVDPTRRRTQDICFLSIFHKLRRTIVLSYYSRASLLSQPRHWHHPELESATRISATAFQNSQGYTWVWKPSFANLGESFWNSEKFVHKYYICRIESDPNRMCCCNQMQAWSIRNGEKMNIWVINYRGIKDGSAIKDNTITVQNNWNFKATYLLLYHYKKRKKNPVCGNETDFHSIDSFRNLYPN